MEENKQMHENKKSIRKWILELGLITVSVFFGLFTNDWWTERKEKKDLSKVLTSIESYLVNKVEKDNPFYVGPIPTFHKTFDDFKEKYPDSSYFENYRGNLIENYFEILINNPTYSSHLSVDYINVIMRFKENVTDLEKEFEFKTNDNDRIKEKQILYSMIFNQIVYLRTERDIIGGDDREDHEILKDNYSSTLKEFQKYGL